MKKFMNTILEIIKSFLDRLQTSSPKVFKIIMTACALISFFILADKWIDFVDLGKIELQYDYINYILWTLFGFGWLSNSNKPKKLFPKLFKK